MAPIKDTINSTADSAQAIGTMMIEDTRKEPGSIENEDVGETTLVEADDDSDDGTVTPRSGEFTKSSQLEKHDALFDNTRIVVPGAAIQRPVAGYAPAPRASDSGLTPVVASLENPHGLRILPLGYVHYLTDAAMARGEIVPTWTEKLAAVAAEKQKARDQGADGSQELFNSFAKRTAVDHKKVTAKMTEKERDAYVASNIAAGIEKRKREEEAAAKKAHLIADEKKRKDEEAKALADAELQEAQKSWKEGGNAEIKEKTVTEVKFDVGTGKEIVVERKRRPTLVQADLSGVPKETFAAKVRRNTKHDERYMPTIEEEKDGGNEENQDKNEEKDAGRQT